MVDLTREPAPAVTATLAASAHSRLRGDPARLRQVLDNLLNNTRHATPYGGHITVRMSTSDIRPGIPPSPAQHRPPGRGGSASRTTCQAKTSRRGGQIASHGRGGRGPGGLACRAWMP